MIYEELIAIDFINDLPFDIEFIAENLSVPWAIAISDDGRLFFTERVGRVRVIENGVLLEQPVITLEPPFVSSGEGGLLGIALDPDFTQNHNIYIMHTYEDGNQMYNRVVRLKEENNQAVIDRVILDKIPGRMSHNGGRIKIGPDQKLYITTGDAGYRLLAQEVDSLVGKILRINLDGSIPSDNPFENSPVYSYGHRNPQGITWNSNGIMYASEHGQSAYDEINIIQPGMNYGWPLLQGDETAEGFEKAMVHSGEITWAPSGLTYIDQGFWEGNLLVATLRGEQLLVITLTEDGTGVYNITSWFVGEFGRLREVVQAKDGSIYLTTSNRDGRTIPEEGDDKIIKLTPK